ncbi:hypothetical protein NCS56_00334500 [Fusarium sp. Ph1]|nr:hypothetical protein NCS56_00334500 [Fusarium sp. Ph1]
MSDDDSDVFGWTSEDRDDSPVVVSQPLARRDTSPLDQARRDRTNLPLLQLADWDEELPYDEQPPTCVYYSIEWKLTLNNRSISKDTEPNLVLAPGPYWSTFLRSKLEKLVDKKLPSNRSFSINDIDIVVYRRVYDLFRCMGFPCGIGPHCWVDTVSKKHYKLKTHHLRLLIKYIQLGNVLQSHDDVPPDVRDLLYAEEAQDISRKRKHRTSSSADSRPINITNVMPPHSSRRSDSCDARPTSEPADTASQAPSYLGLTGMRDVNVTEYCTWHCSKFRMDQDADFFIEKGVKVGIARRWVNDVEIWFREEKALESE